MKSKHFKFGMILGTILATTGAAYIAIKNKTKGEEEMLKSDHIGSTENIFSAVMHDNILTFNMYACEDEDAELAEDCEVLLNKNHIPTNMLCYCLNGTNPYDVTFKYNTDHKVQKILLEDL